MNNWIEVDGYKEVPFGLWLAKIEKYSGIAGKRKLSGYEYHVIHRHKNVTTIGHHFAFDTQKVVAYKDVGINDSVPSTDT